MCIYVCFFISLFWWNRLPQNWQGYGLVSEWIRRWVLSVLDLLKALPHCLHSNTFSAECTALCCVRLISWPKVLLHNSQANGRLPLCDRLAWTCINQYILYVFANLHINIIRHQDPLRAKIEFFFFDLFLFFGLNFTYNFNVSYYI